MLLSNLDVIAQAPQGVARLRELILTLAVQGKLVPQDPKDEPASELLKKIRAEKDRLIAEGKIKKDKPLAGISEEEKPFELPVGWEWVPLQYIGYTQTGTTPDKKNSEYYGGDIPFIKPGDIYYGYVDYENEGLSKLGLEESGRVAKKGSVLMVCIGTIGKANIIERDCSFNQQINAITPILCVSEFVSLYLRCPEFQSQAWGRSSSTTIAIINKGKWEEIPVALPPFAEQSRIVARVEELMCLCDALEEKGRLEHTQHQQLLQALLDSLTQNQSAQELAQNWQRLAQHFDLLIDRPEAVDALEQTILQLAVRGLLVPQDANDEPASELLKKIRAEKNQLIADGKIKKGKVARGSANLVEPFPLPRGWIWASFPELGEFGRGKSKHRPRNDPLLFNPPIYPLIQTGEVARAKKIIGEIHSKYSEFGLAQSRIWPKGTLCITIAANIADAAILGFDACFPDSVVGFIPLAEKETVNYYLAFMETAKAEISAYAPATAQKNINLEILESIRIPIPPLAEQSRIVARVTELRALCQQLRDKLTLARSTQAQLARAMADSALQA